MKKVLVIGSSGAMGRYLVPELADMGYAVTAVSLDKEAPCRTNVTCRQGNAKDKAFLTALLSEGFDGIVDFMVYPHPEFAEYMPLFLEHTDHYIFLSSCRVYDDKEQPIKETSPRLLDTSDDEALKQSNDYCIYKALAENMLTRSSYTNWTVVRPATTFSTMRYQLVTLEAADNVGRALKGKKVLLPIQAKDKPATLSWAGDVAKMIARILFKKEALRETYNVCSAEYRTWEEIAAYYKDLVGLETVWIDKEDYLAILDPDMKTSTRWQLEYARLFHRITDNSKVLALTGLQQSDLMPMYEGLKKEIAAIPASFTFPETPVGQRMDAYLAEHGL